LKLFLHLELAN